MPRLRRPPEAAAIHAPASGDGAPSVVDRIDPRAVLVAPDEIQRDPDALYAWVSRHHPRAILSTAEVERNARRRRAVRERRTAARG